MQTDLITITCLNTSGGFNCTTPSIFSGGEMFISLLLLIGLILAIISMIRKGIFSVSVHKKESSTEYQHITTKQEHYKL